MTNSMAEQLRRNMQCEGILECLHGLNELEGDCFRAVVESDEPLTIDEVADRVDRERSTVYRSIQRLRRNGFLHKEQVNYDHGGYYHVYSPVDPSTVASDMQRLLNDWYATMGQLIQEFEDTYGREDDHTANEGR